MPFVNRPIALIFPFLPQTKNPGVEPGPHESMSSASVVIINLFVHVFLGVGAENFRAVFLLLFRLAASTDAAEGDALAICQPPAMPFADLVSYALVGTILHFCSSYFTDRV
jgi:hypothetical protein